MIIKCKDQIISGSYGSSGEATEGVTMQQVEEAIASSTKDLATNSYVNNAIQNATNNMATNSSVQQAIQDATQNLVSNNQMNSAIQEAIKDLPTNESLNNIVRSIPIRTIVVMTEEEYEQSDKSEDVLYLIED